MTLSKYYPGMMVQAPQKGNGVVDTSMMINQVRSGDIRAMSRLISMVESGDLEAGAILESLGPSTGQMETIGITGYPGVGKSTLVDRLATAYRAEGKKVGILAIDTSSPLTGGLFWAIASECRVIRWTKKSTSGAWQPRGHRGGLSQATSSAIRVLEAAGYDIVLIETVGVGQEEGEITKVAQTVVAVVAPGLGDEVQAMKAGLLEVAHLVVVNKADREGADTTIRDLQDWVSQVVATVALRGEGIGSVKEAIAAHQKQIRAASHANV